MGFTKKMILAIVLAGCIGALTVSPVFGQALDAAANADMPANPLAAPHILPPL